MKTLCLFLAVVMPAAGALAREQMPPLTPKPQQVSLGFEGLQFTLARSTRIYSDTSAREAAEYLAAKLRPATGFPLHIGIRDKTFSPKGIFLTTDDANTNLGPEGYELAVEPQAVVIRAPKSAGLFYGAQTLLQLFPAEIFSTNRAQRFSWKLPALRITDQPRFAWRGFMLDVSRHFFTKDEVKQLLDQMAALKLNTFHWHLVDDQGWRIEIKKYPRLTAVGAWRSGIGFGLDPTASTAYGPDGRYGGFYTQADIREVVAYAQARHITIVPEIELPGHSVAALAAMPELSCTGGGYSTDVSGGVQRGIYCAGKEETFTFLTNVLTEVVALFPGRYIHVGGDEVPKDNWRKCPRCQIRMQAESLKNAHELQSYFIRRMENFLASKGRTLIGWSEIREGGLARNAAVMDWIGGATEAASAGHDVVMSPMTHCYLNFYQSEDHTVEPQATGRPATLQDVYEFEPIPADLAPEFQQHILGTQGNLWTEYIPNLARAEYMIFPRLNALAEVAWSPKSARNFDDFKHRLAEHNRRLDFAGINYRRETWSKVGGWTPEQLSSTGTTQEWDVTKSLTAAGEQRVCFSHVEGMDGLNIAWATLLEDGKEISRDTHAGFAGGKPHESVYTLKLPALKTGAQYKLQARLTGTGGFDSRGNVLWQSAK